MEYRLETRATVPDEIVAQCVSLYSSCYGKWGKSAPEQLVGKNVKMSNSLFRKNMLFDDPCFVSLALEGSQVIGQAFCKRFHYSPLAGNVLWITQLVVHPLHRHKGIATRLIQRAIDWRCDVAAGLVSSHPYAIRALEAATKTRVVPELLSQHAQGVIRCSQVPYTRDAEITGYSINTHFFVDHSEVNAIRERDPEWKLGPFDEGHEAIGIVFGFAKKNSEAKHSTLVQWLNIKFWS